MQSTIAPPDLPRKVNRQRKHMGIIRIRRDALQPRSSHLPERSRGQIDDARKASPTQVPGRLVG